MPSDIVIVILVIGGGYGSSGFTCEEDELAQVAKQIKDSGIVKNNGSFLWSYKDTFKGKEFVDWWINSTESDFGIIFIWTSMDYNAIATPEMTVKFLV